MLLVESYCNHGAALRASFRAEYRVALTDVGVLEAADMAAWLPHGSALWRSTGGQLALSETDHILRVVDYRLQVLAWMQTKDARDGRNKPTPPAKVPLAGEVAAERSHDARQLEARKRRAAS